MDKIKQNDSHTEMSVKYRTEKIVIKSKIFMTPQVCKGQLYSEWIYEVIVSPEIPTKNYRNFCPGSLLEGRAEISVIFGWDFGRNDDLINSLWI